jgi:hypothetical protein
MTTHICVKCGQPIPAGEMRYDAAHQTYHDACYRQAHELAGTSVVVRDIQMPFGSMVVFMVKWAIAAIPAAIILIIVGVVFGACFGGLVRSMAH